jgi:hypothetical protein
MTIFTAIQDRDLDLVKEIVEADPHSLFLKNEFDTSVINYETSLDGGTEILEFLWPRLSMSVSESFKIFRLARDDKSVFFLERVPELFDFRCEPEEIMLSYFTCEAGDTVLHIVAETDRPKTMKYILERRPDLVLVANEYGNLPIHRADDIGMMHTLFTKEPKTLLARGLGGQVPFHFYKNYWDRVELTLDMMRQYPEVLECVDDHGFTIAMSSFARHDLEYDTIKSMFEINPRSFLLKNKESRNFLHFVFTYKDSYRWYSAHEPIIEAFPELLFEQDVLGNSVLDCALNDMPPFGGGDPLEKKEFFRMCQKHTPLPDKYCIFNET